MRNLAFIIALTSIVCGHASAQTVRYVRANAPAGGDGQSWATAYNTLQPAIAAAVAGDEIWVAAGTYSDPSTTAPAAFNLRSGIAMYGGFSGAETLRSQRSPSTNATVLSGNGNKTVLRLVNVTQVVVDGFLVSGGKGRGTFQFDNTGNGWHPGGGLSIDGSNASVVNCTFQLNSATWSFGGSGSPTDGGEGGGGAIRNSSVLFDGCTFQNNASAGPMIAGCGGGQYQVWTGPGGGGGLVCRSSTISLVDCVFTGNSAGSGAGTGYCTQWGSGANTPGVGASGGAIEATACTMQIDRCSFIANNSGHGGGGANVLGNCITTSARSGNGGALSLVAGTTTISNSLFSANFVPRSGIGGCSNDVGGLGSAIHSTGTVTIFNSTFHGNNALATNGGRGTLAGTFSAISNCVFWGNTDGSGNVFVAQTGNVAISQFRRSILQGYVGSAQGNFGTNPRFLNPLGPDNTLGTADDRFDLAITSPAIDAGNNSLYSGSALDLSGNARFFDVLQVPDTGVGTAPIIDIGPYEFSRCPADLDNGSGSGTADNAVTIDDLLYFLAAFESGTNAADLDNGAATGVLDNAVTIDDLLFFLVRFEIGC